MTFSTYFRSKSGPLDPRKLSPLSSESSVFNKTTFAHQNCFYDGLCLICDMGLCLGLVCGMGGFVFGFWFVVWRGSGSCVGLVIDVVVVCVVCVLGVLVVCVLVC